MSLTPDEILQPLNLRGVCKSSFFCNYNNYFNNYFNNYYSNYYNNTFILYFCYNFYNNFYNNSYLQISLLTQVLLFLSTQYFCASKSLTSEHHGQFSASKPI